MTTDLAALRERFHTAVNHFNGGNFKESDLDQYGLDDRVTMRRLDDPSSRAYHEGIAAVKRYFLGNGNADKAKFTPDSEPDFRLVDGFGFVSGTATFVDKTVPSSTPERRIAYSFAYTSTSGEWKAIYLWGKYIDKK